jgi:LuxR family maltose regulon positive regulatory protein
MRQAEHLYRQVIDRLEHAPMDRDQALIRKGRALLGLGALALEENDLKAAEQYVAEGVAIGQQFPDEYLLAHGPLILALILARLQQARGETKSAQEILGALAAQAVFPLLLREVRTYQARLSLVLGDLAAAQRWFDSKAQPADDFLAFYEEKEALVVARLRIAQGQAAEALRLLGSGLAGARAHGRVRSEMEIEILVALAHAALDDLPQAKQALVRALALAHPEGYQRLFLDEGEPMRLLIADFRMKIEKPGRERLLDFVDRLLMAFPETDYSLSDRSQITNQQAKISNLIEPLSEQERRVLRLLGEGLTNPEIAQELVVSINTVKSHVKSVYRKLNVSGRSEARRAARLLNLV